MKARIERDLRGEEVLISPGRSARPYDFRSRAEERRARCPFCPGREEQTPPEVDAVREPGTSPDTPGWSVRVVPNKYPAFPREPDPVNPGAAFGVHEAIIETPDHERGLADLSADELTGVLEVWQRRFRAAAGDARLGYGCIFKNHGPQAGASLEHSHSQFMATPGTPQRIAAEARAAERGELGRRMREELDSERVVLDVGAVRAFCPRDARFPHEVWLTPAAQELRFEQAGAEVLADTARALARLLPGLRAIHGAEAPFHVLVYTAPFRAEKYWWRVEVFPRTARVAGYELATGIFVNQVDPGAAAEDWRRAVVTG